MEPSATEFLQGMRLLDRYEVVETIGRGGYGVVYKAKQLSTGVLVAIKTLHVDGNREPEFAALEQARFARERELIRRLKNPNAVRLMDWGEVDGRLLLVLEYVEGVELSERLTHGPLGPRLTRRVMGQVLEVLAEAHHQGILHRDLKPSNIMLVGSPRRPHAKVLDFGIAGVTPEHRGSDWVTLTGRREIRGTPSYMAPEQVFGDTNTQSDVYALGLILLECLTGQTAFAGNSPAAVMRAQVELPVPITADVANGPFGSIIARACAKRQEDRYHDAEQMLNEFEQILFPHGTPASWDLSTDSIVFSRQEIERYGADSESGDFTLESQEVWAGPTIDSTELAGVDLEFPGHRGAITLDTMSGEVRLSENSGELPVSTTTAEITPARRPFVRWALVALALLCLGAVGATLWPHADAPTPPRAVPEPMLRARAGEAVAFHIVLHVGPAIGSLGRSVAGRLRHRPATTPEPKGVIRPPVDVTGDSAPEIGGRATPSSGRKGQPSDRLKVWNLSSTPPAQVHAGNLLVCGRTPCTITYRLSDRPASLQFSAEGHKARTTTLPVDGGDVKITLTKAATTTVLD